MSHSALIVPLLILLSSGPALGGRFAAQNLPRVCIHDGCLYGTWMRSVSGAWFEAYFGIPFAKPPIEELRFASPVPNDPWEEKELDATGQLPKPPCVQVNLLIPGRLNEGAEDCLYLNVYRPARQNGSTNNATTVPGLPTMVYIYGGGYLSGYNSPLIHGPEKLMDHPVILVTISYRVGVFGFLSTGDEAASGNFGLKDQRLALRWVNRNIKSFGGDPRLVTIMGQSAGGASVQLQMMHLANEGLFQRAISLSGSALGPWNTPLANPERLARQQATLVGIQNADTISTIKLVKALRKVDANQLANSIVGFTNGSRYPVVLFSPTVENPIVKDSFLTASPRQLWAQGSYLPVPWLTGLVPNDGFVLSAPLLRKANCSKRASMQQETLLLSILRRLGSVSTLPLLKERFFSNASSIGKCFALENMDGLTKLLGEACFDFPALLSVKQQLQHGKESSRAPTYVYKFNYKGQLSYSSILATGDNATLSLNFGIVHCDELNYIFRSPALFPDFHRDSPDARAAQRFTKFLVDFARKGVLKRNPGTYGTGASKEDEFPVALEFFNKKNPQKPLGVRDTNIYDKDMFNFWTRFYSS